MKLTLQFALFAPLQSQSVRLHECRTIMCSTHEIWIVPVVSELKNTLMLYRGREEKKIKPNNKKLKQPKQHRHIEYAAGVCM